MAEEVKAGRFREDLYYRLNVFPLNTLRLSDRKFDVPVIVSNMLFNLDKDSADRVKISGQAVQLSIKVLTYARLVANHNKMLKP